MRRHPRARHEHALVLRLPEVVRVGRAAARRLARVDVEGEERAALPVLLREAAAGRAVAEPPHAPGLAEVMIQGAGLLGHDDHVLDVLPPPGTAPARRQGGQRIEREARAERESGGEQLATRETRIAPAHRRYSPPHGTTSNARETRTGTNERPSSRAQPSAIR